LLNGIPDSCKRRHDCDHDNFNHKHHINDKHDDGSANNHKHHINHKHYHDDNHPTNDYHIYDDNIHNDPTSKP
jgi:hypothetical protein